MKASWNNSDLHESQSFIQVPCVDIAFNNSIELHNRKAKFLTHFQTVFYQLLPNVKSTAGRRYRITGIADMPTASDIVRVQNIEANDLPGIILGHTAITL